MVSQPIFSSARTFFFGPFLSLGEGQLGYTCIGLRAPRGFAVFRALALGMACATADFTPVIQRESVVGSQIIDIRRFEVSAFSELLDAESRAWNEDLYWDFKSSARVISTCLKEKRLSGYALVLDGIVRGYCFFFCRWREGPDG